MLETYPATELMEQEVAERSSLSPYQRQRIQRAEQIHTCIQRVSSTRLKPNERGEAWREALYLGSTEPKRLRDAKQVFDMSKHRFEEKGEGAVREIASAELNEVAKVNFDLALAVKEGSVSREAALVIAKTYGKKLNNDRLLELSSAFAAREPKEKLEDFEVRRKKEIEGLKKIDGHTEQETWIMKRKIQDVLEIYNMLEAAGIDKTKWPTRAEDGQIRRSFINRSGVLDVAIKVLDDIHSCHNLESKMAEIEKGGKIPKEIKRLEQVIDVVEERGDVKAVTFDMFDTLVQWTGNLKERHKLMLNAAPRVFEAYGISVTPQEFQAIRDPIWYGIKNPKALKGEEFQAIEALTQIAQEVARKKGVRLKGEQSRQIAQNLENAFISIDSDTAVPMPGAIYTLRALKDKGVKVGLISNHPFNEHSVKLLLRKYGLLKYIDGVTVSSDVGYLKSPADPNSRIFKASLKKLGVHPEAVLHVGDNPEADQKAPARLGVRGIVYNNPNTTQKTLEARGLDSSSSEYRERSLDAYKDASRLNGKSYYNANKGEFTPLEFEKHALRFYEISRDTYAPLMIKFAEENLERLQRDPQLLNLCVGRDGLASFLVQRKLIELFPEKYSSVDAKRVQYTHMSRELKNKADRSSMSAFLNKTGFNRSARVNIVDNGIAGSIQSRLIKLFPEKDIEGNYLLSRKFRDDPYINKKHGFILESDATRVPGTEDVITGEQIVRGRAEAGLLPLFLSSDFVHDQEDMWNGIFESAKPLKEKEREVKSLIKGKMQVKKEKVVEPENLYQRMDYVPGNQDAIPGLNNESIENYLLLKKMGLKGIVDGIHLYRRQTQLGVNYTAEDSIKKLGTWFSKANDDKRPSIDNALIRGMVRHRV